MLDIDFIITPPPLTRPLLYVFRSGALRRSVQQILRAHAEAPGENRIFGIEGPVEFYTALNRAAFLPVFTVCAWSDKDSRSLDLNKLIDAVSARKEPDIALFVPADSLLLDAPNWPSLERSCFVVKESPVNEKTVAKYLSFFLATTDLLQNQSLFDEHEFVHVFKDYTRTESPDLFALKHYFDRVVLLQTDPRTGDFSEREPTRRCPHQRPSSLRLLRRFLTEALGRDLVEWVRLLDETYDACGWSGRDVVCYLYRLTCALHHRNRAATPEFNRNLTVWSILCLASETRILNASCKNDGRARRPPDLVVFTVEQMAREFIARLQLGDPTRRLQIANVVDEPKSRVDDRILSWRRKTLELACSLLRSIPNPDAWVLRFEAQAQSALTGIQAEVGEHSVAEPKQRARVGADPPFKPASFGEVLGHAGPVEGLRRRLRAGGDRSILLHGPDGVGKLTLARLYAKALFCAERTNSDSPCARCESCRNFDSGNVFGYTEFDAWHHNSLEAARALADELKSDALPAQRVYVIRSADSYSSQAFDVFLKRIEDLPSSITFILLAEDIRKVRLAIQSRCEVWALKPLSPIDTKYMARQICLAYGHNYEDHLLTLLAQASHGLPGRLHEKIPLVQRAGKMTYDELLRTLDLNWINDFSREWLGVLSPPRITEDILAERTCKQGIYSLQTLLALIKDFEINDKTLEMDAAFGLADRKILRDLLERLQSAARINGIPVNRMWHQLAESALSGVAESDAAHVVLGGIQWSKP